MSEYPEPFELSFMERTLDIVNKQKDSRDATLLLNCLLGLLVLPRETFINKEIPKVPISSLTEWGISTDAIKKSGKCQCGDKYPKNIGQFVCCLRNAVAHFNIKPIHDHGEVMGFKFNDRSGFVAKLSLNEIREFTRKLAKHLCDRISAIEKDPSV